MDKFTRNLIVERFEKWAEAVPTNKTLELFIDWLDVETLLVNQNWADAVIERWSRLDSLDASVREVKK